MATRSEERRALVEVYALNQEEVLRLDEAVRARAGARAAFEEKLHERASALRALRDQTDPAPVGNPVESVDGSPGGDPPEPDLTGNDHCPRESGPSPAEAEEA